MLRCARASLWKHFVMMRVSATGWKSLRLTAVDCFGTGLMVVILKHAGTAAWTSDRLNKSVQTPVSCTAPALRITLNCVVN